MTQRPEPDDDDTVSVSTRSSDDDPTVVVARGGEGRVEADLDPTVVVDRDETVVVDRDDTAPVDDEDTAPADDTVEVDRADTVVVDRDGTAAGGRERADPDTVIVAEGSAPPDADPDATNVVPRDASGVTVEVPRRDPTVRVERGASESRTHRVDLAGSTPIKPAMAPPRKRRRGELRPAPVPSGFGGLPLVASGAGAVSSYGIRGIQPPPARLVRIGPSAPHRVVARTSSVGRRSRRLARAAIIASAGSVLVLAGGVVWALKDLVGF